MYNDDYSALIIALIGACAGALLVLLMFAFQDGASVNVHKATCPACETSLEISVIGKTNPDKIILEVSKTP